MMGPMIGSNASWAPMLIFPLVSLAALAAAAVVMTRAARSVAPSRQPPVWRPGESGDSRPGSAGSGPGDDPLFVLRERYASGEISHTDFIRALDQVLRVEESPVLARPGAESP